MEVQLPKLIHKTILSLESKGFEIYIVGGAVRDLLMNREVYDWDFTTNAAPKDLLKIFPKGIYDNAFGTVMIPNKLTQSPFDITTFRTEHGYSDARRPDKVEWGKTLDEDLKRRDFTINAMALKPEQDGKSVKKSKKKNPSAFLISGTFSLIDLYGGQKDLGHKLIRSVGDPNDRFSEDALRMMRAVRIASELGFTIERKTLEAIKQNASLINKIAKERVRDEIFKILASPYSYQGMIFFKETGLMEQILPELYKTFGVEQKSPGRHHIYDVGNHSFFSLKNCPSNDPLVRFATLIHDIGKPLTYKKLPTGTITFYNHEIVGSRVANRISDRLKFSNKQKDRLFKLVRYHQFTVDEKQTDSSIRRFIRKVGLENIPDMLDLRVGDRLGGGVSQTSWRLEEFKNRLLEVQKQPFSVRDLKISGYDVMHILNIKPGPKVGELLDILYEEVVKKSLQNEKDELTKRLKEINNA